MAKYGIIIGICLTLSILDILTGYLKSILNKTTSSSKMREGLIKKAVQYIVISVSALLQFGQGYLDLGVTLPILPTVCGLIIWMEVTSILENADSISGGKLRNIIDKILKERRD